MKSNRKYLFLTAGLFIAEVLIATVFARIVFVRSYVGDYLVVILLYCLVKIFYDGSPGVLAGGIFGFACVVEILQYFHIAEVLGLAPESLAGIVVGTSFSWVDIGMYWLGCLTVYCVASVMRFRGDFKRQPQINAGGPDKHR